MQSDTRRVAYQNISSLCDGLRTANLADWQLSKEAQLNHLKFSDPSFAVPEYHEENFCFTIAVFNWKLPATHSIYGDKERSLEYLNASLLLSRILDSQMCHGVSYYNVTASAIINAVPKTISLTSNIQFEYMICKRAPACRVLLDKDASSKCFDCQQFENKAYPD